jgi:hypothetical protein
MMAAAPAATSNPPETHIARRAVELCALRRTFSERTKIIAATPAVAAAAHKIGIKFGEISIASKFVAELQQSTAEAS